MKNRSKMLLFRAVYRDHKDHKDHQESQEKKTCHTVNE